MELMVVIFYKEIEEIMLFGIGINNKTEKHEFCIDFHEIMNNSPYL
jgi:hypothetical protein